MVGAYAGGLALALVGALLVAAYEWFFRLGWRNPAWFIGMFFGLPVGAGCGSWIALRTQDRPAAGLTGAIIAALTWPFFLGSMGVVGLATHYLGVNGAVAGAIKLLLGFLSLGLASLLSRLYASPASG